VATVLNRAVAPESQPKTSRFYLPELDGLRLFAFVLVFLCHVGPDDTLFHMGSFGVDLFFALSAYLITELLVREKERFGIIDVRSFYVRRALRIWPLYFAFLAAMFLITSISWPYFAFCAVFLGNFGFSWMGVPNNIINPLWSLSVEEQFYLLWPWAVKHFDRGGLAMIAAVLWAVSICFRYIVRAHPAIYLYCTLGRLDSIAAGILVSCFLEKRCLALVPLTRTLLGLAGGYAWVMAGVCAESGFITPVYALVAVGCCAFLIATIGSSGWIRNPIFMYLGRISYGLYVFHGAIIVAFASFFPSPTTNALVLRSASELALTILLAAASYRWLESPFLRLKMRFQHIASQPV
jgi:peptidoglycan/LPS O-acetylase OafA/YrhL